jgi:aldose 1-epimerase
VTNLGSTPCPYGTGAQPYLALGTELVDDLSVCVPAGTWLLTDDRGIPTGRRTVDGTDRDLRRPGRLGDRVLDTAFTDLSRDADGGATIVVRAPTRREVELWMDASYGFVALSTGDSLPEPDRRRHGLGVEPMTAAPNAFRTGDGLATVAPGGSHSAVWELRPRWL